MATTSIQQIPFTTTCDDGVTLGGILLIPTDPKAVVQFNGGTGAKKEFYLAFVNYLAEHGYVVCLWDYRGIGQSAPSTLRGCTYQYRDYGLQDMPAIRRFLENRYPNLPLLLVGHSAGGQQIAFSEGVASYKGLVAIAVSTGYLKPMPWLFKLKYLYFFYCFTPLSHLIWQCVRAKRFGIMEDLPTPVVKEWRQWCSKLDYFFDPAFANKTVPVDRYESLPFPVHVFWTVDDDISNEANIQQFWSHIKSDRGISFRKIVPEEMGVRMINHFGFFKKHFRETLWKEALDQLDHYLQMDRKGSDVDIKKQHS